MADEGDGEPAVKAQAPAGAVDAASGAAATAGGSGGGEGGESPADALAAKEAKSAAQQQNAFDLLEHDFREVLNELVGDKSLERFRAEYEKLHHALRKSHENEKKLIKKCRELNSEIVINAGKVQAALRMSRSDQNNITLLKKEIDSAWKIVEAAQEKEKRARETASRLKAEIEKLSRIVDQGAGLSLGQETAVNELLKEKQELLRQIEQQTAAGAQQAGRVQELEATAGELEQAKGELEREVHELRARATKLATKAERESRRAERVQAEMVSLKEVTDAVKGKLTEKQGELEAARDEAAGLASGKKELEYALDRYRDVAEELRMKHEAMEKSIGVHVQNQSALMTEKEAAEAAAETRREEIRRLSQELAAASRKRDRLEADRDRLAAARSEAEGQRDALRQDMAAIQKEVELQTRNADTDEKLIRDLQQQVKRLTGSLAASRDKNRMQLALVRHHEEVKKALEQDILRHKTEEEQLRRRNYELEKQREKAAMSASNWQAKTAEAEEQTKMREMEAAELQKKVGEEREKLKLQQTLYEQVRSDRNLFSKQHIQSQDEIAELKRKFKIMTHQIEQLKEEIQSKDHALINEHFAFKRLKDEMKVLKRKLGKREEVLSAADEVLGSQDAEVKNLRRTLMEAEQAQRQQKAVYDDVVQERDILGTQLIRRNDELALLYEKIRIQQSTLSKGELQYRERLAEINALRLQLNDARRELQVRQHEVTNVDALKNEIHHIQRELLQERTKVKALSEELENPMNVHRWRRLEGSDPKRYELIQKIQMLQKRLISKTEEAVEKDMLLQEKERLYVELKNILARQPGPEVAEQLSVYQQGLKEKNRQMKAMAAELNMLQAQSDEYRYEVERLTRELQDVKRKFYEQRRKDQALRETLQARTPEGALAADPGQQQQRQFYLSQPRIAGGGFNLSAAASAAAAARAQARQQQQQQQQQAAAEAAAATAATMPREGPPAPGDDGGAPKASPADEGEHEAGASGEPVTA